MPGLLQYSVFIQTQIIEIVKGTACITELMQLYDNLPVSAN